MARIDRLQFFKLVFMYDVDVLMCACSAAACARISSCGSAIIVGGGGVVCVGVDVVMLFIVLFILIFQNDYQNAPNKGRNIEKRRSRQTPTWKT